MITFYLFRKILKWTLYLAILAGLMVWASDAWINRSTKAQLYSNTASIPARKVGLVLGANKNLYFAYRMQAAAELYKAGKVKYLLVSGDNHREDYDEPTEMKATLVELGVPDSCIYLDYAGFRTFDSMVRCKEVFGEDTITVISQQFHNQRALFIANHKGIDAIAYNAHEVGAHYSPTTSVREYFARVKCVLDLFVFHTKPKFLGDRIVIGQFATAH